MVSINRYKTTVKRKDDYMRTVKEKEVVKVEEVKPEDFNGVSSFNLVEAFALWENTSKAGGKYLSGSTHDSKTDLVTKLVGFFNTNKKNPKEPDIRIYSLDADGKQDIEVASLWNNVSESKGTSYLTGMTNDKEKLVGFYAKEKVNGRPDIRVYYQED